MKSSRQDRRGHWPKGKRRSNISREYLRVILRHLERTLEYPGLSQRGLARHVGVSEKTVRRWLSEECWPSEEFLEALEDWIDQCRKR